MRRFVSWRLWLRLRHPPDESPVYQRALGQSGAGSPWTVGCAEMIGFVLFMPLFLFMGPLYGLAWAVGIAGSLNAAQSSGTTDLMALTPLGPLGAWWAFACAALYRNRTFANINSRNTWAGRGVIVLLVYAALILLPRTATGSSPAEPLLGLAGLAAFIAVDHVQSIVLAVLIGLIAPTTSSQRVAVQWNAAAAYVTVQLGSYALTALLMGLLAAVYSLAQVPAVDTLTLTLLGGLAFFAAGREWLIRRLWQQVRDRLGADEAVLDQSRPPRL